mgnify:CR=1 FL=1
MASDGKGTRTIFHFAWSDERLILPGDEWAYECARSRSITKWQSFFDGDRINHIVNMDSVTFIEVVGDA